MLDKIAKEIMELEDMPNDKRYKESCLLVALNVYKLNDENARKVVDKIMENIECTM